MHIKYNPIEKSISIKDGVKTSLFVSKMLMILTFVNSILFFRKGWRTGDTSLMVFWIILGIASLVLGWLFIFKKSSLDCVPIAMIIGVKERNFIGQERYALLLNNGKQRDLMSVKTAEELQELKMILAKCGK
ncbi:MAG: hypothetical protein COB81_06490 [Flavobacteriaceae bacterium]|nr:MAG: hypothetical protein COB81_06490 [Flavobacteriaceae bacterium]